MSHYIALPHTEQEADRMSDTSSAEGDTTGEPHQTVITALNRQNADTSPAVSHSSAQPPTDVLHKGNGFQQASSGSENLGSSQSLGISRNDGGSATAAALLGVSPSKRESVLSSVLHQLRKPSFETMYSMVEDDDYAVLDLPEDQGANSHMKSKEDRSKAGSPDAKSVESHVGNDTVSKGRATEDFENDHDSPADTTTTNVKGHSPVSSASKTEEAKQESPVQPIDTSASKPGRRASIAILIPSPPAQSTTTSHRSRPETPTSVVPETPISVHSSVDIASPTPDLQSLQGAYAGNIQRLERSVEHLSGTSDIDSELRKMEREMKDRASSSGSASARRSTSAIGSPVSGPIVASPERYAQPTNMTTSPRAALAMHLHSHSGSYPATSRLPNTLNEVPEPDESDTLLGGDLSMASDINDAASFTRSAMPPPMTPSPTLQPVLDVQVTTPSTIHADQHENIAEDLDIPQFEYGSYGYENGHALGYHQPDLFMPTYPPQMQHDLFIQRPPSAASGDTYQQAKIAFKDFDGVHIGLHPKPSVSIRRFDMDGASLNELPTNSDGSPLTTAIGPDGQPKNIEGLVYYPAPVPRMLNMPVKLSKNKPDARQQKRRNQILVDTIAATSEHSESSGPDGSGTGRGKRKNPLAKLPPALRAAAFFDGPMPGVDNAVLAPLNGSAVQTLDAVLDAAASAPVDTTLDGGLLTSVRSKHLETSDAEDGKKRRGFLRRNKGKQKAVVESKDYNSGDERPGTRDRLMPFNRQSTYEADKAMLAPDKDEGFSDEEAEPEGQLDSDEDAFHGAPATLLAELELRKKAQKKRTKGKDVQSRTRTGVGNMGSTLLEMDTVARLQNEARRKKKHITLAWEDPNAGAANPSSDDDDDVPLAVLLKNKTDKQGKTAEGLQKQIEDFKPSGLMAQLDQEENEPLARRRARLRGETQLGLPNRRSMMYPQALSLMQEVEEESEEELEGETLAQRAARLRQEETETLAERIAQLKREKEKKDNEEGLSSDFAKDLLNLFDESKGDAKHNDKASEKGSQNDDENGEREKRTSRYRTTKNESIDKRQSRIVPRPQIQVQPQTDSLEPENREEETLEQRKVRLQRESQGDPVNAAAASNEGAAERRYTITPAKARSSLANVLAAHPQHHSISLLQQDRPHANPNQNSRTSPYADAGMQVAKAIGTPLYASDGNRPPRVEHGGRPGTILGDSAKRKSALNLYALNTAANSAARQPGGLQDINPQYRDSGVYNHNDHRATTMTGYQGLDRQQRQSMLTLSQNPGPCGAQHPRALTVTGTPGPLSQRANVTKSMTFQGMPLYAHYHADNQQSLADGASKAPNSGDDSQQPYRMSHMPGLNGQSPGMVSTNALLAPSGQLAHDGSMGVTAGYSSGFAQGYQAGIEHAWRMAMMATPQTTGEGEAVDQWRQNVAYLR